MALRYDVYNGNSTNSDKPAPPQTYVGQGTGGGTTDLFQAGLYRGANPQKGNNKGQNFDYLSNYLKDSMSNGLPFKDALRQFATGGINKSFDASSMRMKEDLAGRGMLGSGASMAAQSMLSGERGSAIGESDARLNEADIDFRSQSLMNLMRMNEFEGTQDQQYGLAMKNLLERKRQFDESLQFEKDNQPEWWESVLGSILGGAAKVGTAYAIGGTSLAVGDG